MLISHKNYDIAIIGNGIVGIFSSFLLKKNYQKKNILLVGNKDFKNSASYVAGAMHAVFCEIEDSFHQKYEQINFEIGLKSENMA